MLAADISLFVVSYVYPFLYNYAMIILFVILVITLLEGLLLYVGRNRITAERTLSEKLSNGDDNKVTITIKSYYQYPIHAEVIDEIPFAFQKRDFYKSLRLYPGLSKDIYYTIKPSDRGEYEYGSIIILASVLFKTVKRRYKVDQKMSVKVYPSIIQMEKYGFYASSNRLNELGMKRIRRTGYSYEFDKIRIFSPGDDIKKINWKASAKNDEIMVNTFIQEKSQPVYNIVDTGRSMKFPFDNLSLLDYAVNSSLVLSNIVLRKGDKAGLITFSDKPGVFLKADKNPITLKKIMEVLYNVKTSFPETDYEKLYLTVSRNIPQRSLLIIYTNYESLYSVQRNIKYLNMIAAKHHIILVNFKNTDVSNFSKTKAGSVKGVYCRNASNRYNYMKEVIMKELTRNNIQPILTYPQDLNVNTINSYIQVKMRGLI